MDVLGGGRNVDLEELKGLDQPGVYILNVPKAVKSYYKVGISEADIEKRVAQYILSYPFGFNIVAVMLYPKDYTRYYKVRDTECEILKEFKEQRVFRYKGMKTSEWIKLSRKKDTERLRQLMSRIAQRDGATLNWFADSHQVTLPSA